MNRRKNTQTERNRQAGFTLMELLVGSVIMIILVLGALTVYTRSNRVSVDQQQYTALQNDVRSSMYLVMRDVRMAGVGLPQEFFMYAIEGLNNEDQGAEVRPDRLKLLGNMEFPLNLPISQYQGSAVVVTVEDGSYEQHPYADDFYVNKIVFILPNPASGCRAGEVRQVTHVAHNPDGTNESMNFSPGLALGIDPPGGLSGTCADSNDYDGGLVTFSDVIEYWLDVTGNFSGLTAGVNGYIGGGVGGVFYMTKNGIHYPLAQNIENFQLEYNGDLDDNGVLDGFRPWDATWSPDMVSRIRQVRVMLLGRTANRFVSVSGRPPANIHHYRRPALSDSPAATDDDLHKRFLLESTSNIRNMSLNLYNRGER